MREIKNIILHCSDSPFGNADLIDLWHKERGFDEIGYHFVILNGYPSAHTIYQPKFDGCLQPGRPLDKAGAHCRGHNADSIGICLIGQHLFTGRQMLDVLPTILLDLIDQFSLSPSDVYGHQELDAGKTCPNLDMAMIRNTLI